MDPHASHHHDHDHGHGHSHTPASFDRAFAIGVVETGKPPCALEPDHVV